MGFTPVHSHGSRPYEWVSSLSERRRSLTPNEPAVTDLATDRTLTYEDVDRRANRVARLLDDHGVGDGDRIALLSRNRLECIDLFFGAAKRGAVLAPLSHRLAPPTVAELLELIDPSLVVVETNVGDLVDGVPIEEPLLSIGAGPTPTDSNRFQRQLPDDDAPVDPVPRALSDPILLLHTGGTTGTPKETVITHGGMLWNSINTITGWGLRPDDVTPMIFPFFHTGGWNVLTVPFFHIGGHVLVDRTVDPATVLESIDAYDTTMLVAVPTVLRSMAEHDRFDRTDLSSLRMVKSGGGPCRDDVIRAWRDRGVDLSQGYGLTECGPNNFGMPAGAAEDRPQSVGVPMPHVDVRVVDDEGDPVSTGEIGELEIASPHAADRYLANPAESSETFGGGWVSTGDLASRDEAGHVFIEGRKKHMFVSGGENVYPAEVEGAIAEHPAVDEVVVLGVADEEWGEVGLAVVECSSPLTLKALRSFLDGRLARFKHPRRLEVVDRMPTSGPDKIDRQSLRDRFATENR